MFHALPLPATALGCKFSYSPEESYLRFAAENSIWQPGVVESFPGLLTATRAADEILAILAKEQVHLQGRHELIKALEVPSLQTVQAHRMDTQLRGLPPDMQGVDWAMQQDPGRAAALGSQLGPCS